MPSYIFGVEVCGLACGLWLVACGLVPGFQLQLVSSSFVAYGVAYCKDEKKPIS